MLFNGSRTPLILAESVRVVGSVGRSSWTPIPPGVPCPALSSISFCHYFFYFYFVQHLPFPSYLLYLIRRQLPLHPVRRPSVLLSIPTGFHVSPPFLSPRRPRLPLPPATRLVTLVQGAHGGVRHSLGPDPVTFTFASFLRCSWPGVATAA